jgi:formylmethanofuran dehydrogenase subunit E
MKAFDALLQESIAEHGHVCAGQVIGVRMAMLGCLLVDVDDPTSPRGQKRLMVYAEIDRCLTDAIASATGCRLGRRTLKFVDYGINAATFVNLETGAAYRIVSTEESKKLAVGYAPEETDSGRRQSIGYQRMPDHLLFRVQAVRVLLGELDMPGPSRRKAVCRMCGQVIRDGREIVQENRVLCRVCAGAAYFIPCASNDVGLQKGRERMREDVGKNNGQNDRVAVAP